MDLIVNVHITCQNFCFTEPIKQVNLDEYCLLDKQHGTPDFKNMVWLYVGNIFLLLKHQVEENPSFPWVSMSNLNRNSGCPKEHYGYLKKLLQFLEAKQAVIISTNVPCNGERMAFVAITSKFQKSLITR
jgi:hypothetical protein